MPSRPRTIATLFLLYLTQGLPFGFQATALRAYLRQSGVSLVGVGLAGALSLPWMFKALWAPLVDRFGSARFGRRKSWIIPLSGLLALTCAAASLVPPERNLGLLLGLVLCMNLFASTQDIAVDALAVDTLGEGELGPANAAQVTGYKAGMLTGGGLLVWASQYIGWRGLFAAMAVIITLSLAFAFTLREAPPSQVAASAHASETRSLRDVLAAVLATLREPASGWLLAFVGTYKIGEGMVDAMFTPFLVDAHFSPSTIGLWVGTWGMAASLLGSLVGGMMASGRPLLRVVGIAALLRSASMLGELYLALSAPPTATAVVIVTVAEHFFGGMLTTAMFAFMMSRVNKSISATHYTVLASVEVLGKSPGSWLSGLLAERVGYAPLFALGTFLSLVFLILLVPLGRREAPRADAVEPARP